MSWRFADCTLDPRTAELRRAGEPVHVERQVFQLLQLLIEQRDRLLTKDEIIERIWDGRAISDSALSSRIKSARAAIGDDGKAQRLIRTLHGQGFRFVGDVEEVQPAQASAPDAPAPAHAPDDPKPSIAVVPFRLIGVAGPYAALAEALPSDLVTDLSRLRWLFVIARESSFQLRDVDIRTVGARLGSRYALTGALEIVGDRMALTAELGDTRDGGVVWTDRLEGKIDAIHEIRRDIASAIIAAIELQIPLHEARRARLVDPHNLDAWAAYHVGLTHLFKGDARDMETARAMFERALALEPGFARAAAGLSSAHFLHGFVTRDRESRQSALVNAHRAIDHDPLDPFANMAMGRALWLEDDLEGSLQWLDRATMLNPNFAKAIYSRGWAETLMGDAESGYLNGDLSMKLSPLDPLGYAFVGVKAMAALVRGDDEEAARIAVQSARAPGAHALIHVLASVSSQLAGNEADAASFAARARAMAPEAGRATFMRSFPYRDENLRERLSAALEAQGL